jgi:hypothetical protein
MRNAIEHIWHFFHLVDSLTYPRHLLHLAILVSDTVVRREGGRGGGGGLLTRTVSL